MIRMCDQDGDGQIDEEEFCKMIFRHSGAPKASKKPPASKLTDQEQIENIREGKECARKRGRASEDINSPRTSRASHDFDKSCKANKLCEQRHGSYTKDIQSQVG
eukprot:UN02498